MGVRIHLTKRGKIGILAVFFVLLAGSGGYLLWRVNQSNTVSPTNSDAGSNGGYGGCTCDSSQWTYGACDTTTGLKNVSCPNDPNCGTSVCGTAKRCQCNSGWQVFPSAGTKTCTELCGDDTSSVTKCTCGANTSGCGTNCKFPSGTSCQTKANSTGKTYIAMCNVADGSVSCEEYNSSQKCWGLTSQCNNPLFPPASSSNTCDSGAWITKPSGVYAYCSDISYSAVGTDSNGISTSSISVLLNNVARTGKAVDSNTTSATVSEILSSSTNCLAPGSYTLSMSWSDTKGATSGSCALSTTFTVSPAQTNPNWSITKGVVEACIDKNTENPTSQLTYTVKVKNTGTASGTIDKIVDTLDGKVVESYVGNISNSGVYADGSITWTLTGTAKTFAINQEKTYTYVLSIPKDSFGEYKNTVTAYPTTGDNVVANADITADCVITEPDTGIFDSTSSKIVLGISLILLGLGAYNLNRLNSVVLFWKKYKITATELRETRRIKNFEKKVVKR